MKSSAQLAIVSLLWLCAVTCPAQQAASSANPVPDSASESSKGWHMDATPYLWFAAIHGTTGVRGHEANIDASVSDVLSNLNLGFMGASMIRHNRLLLPMDFMWVKLTDEKGLPFEQGPTSVKGEFRQTIFTPGVGYRFMDREFIKMDAYGAVRYWHLNSSLNLNPSTFGGFSQTSNWVDGLGGLRIEGRLNKVISFTLAGDAGAGQANSDYELMGIFGFRVAKKWTLRAGYRYMGINYRPDSSFVYDVAQQGIIFGATWSIK